MENDEFFQFYEENKMGIKTADGTVIIPAVYDFVACMSDDLFTVTENGYTAYFDAAGNVTLPFSNKYESYGNFTEGLARVMRQEKWGFINKNGDEVIPPVFHYTEEFCWGRAIVRNRQELHGAIDERGNLVIDYRYPVLANFDNGYAKFGDLKTWGLIDTAGNVVVPQLFISIGKVHKNTVTVQVLEGEEYKEGELTIGGQVQWNNNLDQLNEVNKRKKQFAVACEQLVGELYESGCACEHERLRNYVQWNKPVGFVDQELLFTALAKKLEDQGNDHFRCPHCETEYKQKWSQYSAFMWVLNVDITNLGKLESKGGPVMPAPPVAIGFYGHGIEKYNEQYIHTDVDQVISYLKG